MYLVMCALLTGCGSPPRPRTTFLQSVDLVGMTDHMAASFVNDPVISAHEREDAQWVISINRIVNNTNQIIPEREKWLYVERLRALLTQSRIGDDYAILWIMPPEGWSMVAKELDTHQDPRWLRTPPTHQLTGTFSALTNTSGRGRSDAYFCSYQLVDLRSATLVWEGSWEVKRAITGLTYD